MGDPHHAGRLLIVATERTEDLGEVGVLHLTMRGQPVKLRVLTIEESDAWLDTLARLLSGLDVPDMEGDAAEAMARVFHAGSDARLSVIAAYDIEGVLGGPDAIRKSMSKQELAAALEVMVEAEGPLGLADARSVVEAFGLPLKRAAVTLRALGALSRPERSPSRPSSTGASPTPTSTGRGRASSSSSGGRTSSGPSSATPGSDGT